MAEWLCILRPARVGMVSEGPTDHERDVVGRHFAYLKGLTDKGTIILVGRTQNNDERTIGLNVFRADSEDAARAIVTNDPAVVEGVMTWELFPYAVALKGF